MKGGLRASMAWLHTWSGLLVGWVLFLVFCAGTASYFRDEITVWMKPELHRALLAPAVPQAEAADRAVAWLQARAPDSPRWFITLPSAREPMVRVSWAPVPSSAPAGGRVRFASATLDPATGAPQADARATRGGDFFYRLHFDLHYMPPVWARWLIGACAMFMLVAILSGIVTHRRIFADFFTFRPKKGQRSWLDAHNATAVLALPYHLMITFTGLVTLMFLYVPWGMQAVYGDARDTFLEEVFPSGGPRDVKRSGDAAPLVPVGPLVAQAQDRWGGAPVGRIAIHQPNDAAATVSLTRQTGAGTASMSDLAPTVRFGGADGRLQAVSGDPPSATATTRGVLYGLHLGRFADPVLRGLFFLSGLAGCLMVATGLLLWAVKERQKRAKDVARGGRAGVGVRLVDGLNLGAIAGLPIAGAAFFWANRLLPVDVAARADAEIRWFFVAWAAAAVAPPVRPSRRMWQLQLALGGALFAALPVLNAVTTSTHLGVSLALGLWAVAGVDGVCGALGLALLWAAWWVGRRSPRPASPRARVAVHPAAEGAR